MGHNNVVSGYSKSTGIPQVDRLSMGPTGFWGITAPISSSIVDHHPVATTDDEPIEDVDLVVPDVDLVVPDVVMDMPLRRSKRVISPQFQMTTLSTYKSMSMMWVMYQIRLPIKKPLLVLNPTSGLMQ